MEIMSRKKQKVMKIVNNQFEKYKEVIDVIAIIQEINPKYEKEEK